jgi:hypothetical protein
MQKDWIRVATWLIIWMGRRSTNAKDEPEAQELAALVSDTATKDKIGLRQ